MLIKEKIFLANCDSVRRLNEDELAKRFLLGVTFAKGVIVTPSLLLDNPSFIEILSRRNIEKWYLEEGAQSISIRIPGGNPILSMTDFFDALPENYILNRYQGKCKGNLSRLECLDMREDLTVLDRLLRRYRPELQPLSLTSAALSERVLQGQTFAQWLAQGGAVGDGAARLADQAKNLRSRSDWYNAVSGALPADAERFRAEVVDTAYHSLFVGKGEAFAMDRIAVLGQIPMPILDAAVSMRGLRREFGYLGYAIKAFDLVSALGANELVKYLTSEAISYLEEAAEEKGYSWGSRRNWFGLYPKLTRIIGVELK